MIGKDLPRLIQFLLFGYSRWYRYKTNYIGHLWQGRYKSPLIQKESYFLECGRYIERNPVRAGVVKRAEDYVWSSYRHYAFGETDYLVNDDPYYVGLGLKEEERRKFYRKFGMLEGPYDHLMDEKLIDTHF